MILNRNIFTHDIFPAEDRTHGMRPVQVTVIETASESQSSAVMTACAAWNDGKLE